MGPWAKSKAATQDAKILRTGGGYILNSMAKVEAQAFLRELRLWVFFFGEIGWKNNSSRHRSMVVEGGRAWLNAASWFCW